MSDDSIPKKVIQGLAQIAEEAGKDVVREAVEMTESVISPKELLGDIKPLSEAELAQKKAEDEKKKQEEAAKLKQNMSERGRNVEQEIGAVRQEINQKEDEEEKKLLEEVRLQREQEEAERQQMTAAMQIGSPAHQKKAAGSAFVPGKKKSQQPDPSQMSQTSEFKGKID